MFLVFFGSINILQWWTIFQ